MEVERLSYWHRKMNNTQDPPVNLNNQKSFLNKDKEGPRYRGKGKNPRKIEKSPTKIKKKFRWHDGQGRQLTAGGLLPYDDEGIWVIGEKKTKGGSLEWTDPGGKYKFEDCDIFTTVIREFSEELYHSTSISREDFLRIKDEHTPTYVNGHQNRPVYICYIVHISKLNECGVSLNPDLFKKNREKVISENPDVPPEYYSSVELKHISYKEVEGAMQKLFQKSSITLSYRLKRILRYGPLAEKLSLNPISLSRSITPDTDSIFSESEEEEPSYKSSSPLNIIKKQEPLQAPVPCKTPSPSDISYMSSTISILVGVQ